MAITIRKRQRNLYLLLELAHYQEQEQNNIQKFLNLLDILL